MKVPGSNVTDNSPISSSRRHFRREYAYLTSSNILDYDHTSKSTYQVVFSSRWTTRKNRFDHGHRRGSLCGASRSRMGGRTALLQCSISRECRFIHRLSMPVCHRPWTTSTTRNQPIVLAQAGYDGTPSALFGCGDARRYRALGRRHLSGRRLGSLQLLEGATPTANTQLSNRTCHSFHPGACLRVRFMADHGLLSFSWIETTERRQSGASRSTLMLGLSIGELVWAAIAAMLIIWIVVTFLIDQIPSIFSVLRWFLNCWIGRLFLLAAWGEAGWHMFCQHP